MDCPECGHKIPKGKERCIYCGATAPEQAGVSGEHVNHENHPDEDRNHVEESRSLDVQGDLQREKDIPNALGESPGKILEEKLVIPFTMEKSRSPRPLSRVIQLLIFFASAAFVGGTGLAPGLGKNDVSEEECTMSRLK